MMAVSVCLDLTGFDNGEQLWLPKYGVTEGSELIRAAKI